jgi:hypothetical protein
VLGALAAGAQGARAQALAASPNGGSVAGTVLAAATGQPIPGAVVALESASDAAVVTASSGPFLARSMVALTDAAGEYRFVGLPPGSYRLVVRHLGYHPAQLQVDLARGAPFRVSVGLVVNPIRLEAMDARAPSPSPYGRLRSAADEARFGRLDAEQYRDQRFLEGDAAVLTHADVTGSVTLGETDLFRAVQRLPGVSTRDDFTAALWTRGAPWSQTRVYFDGLALFNPVHAIGVFAGVNPDAVGAATFHPGVRSSAIGEGAAGVLNVTSRRAERPGLRALGELSVISARGAADWESRGGRTSLMFAARRSYVDLASRIAQSLGGDSSTYIPYDFFDFTSRFDADLGRGYALEASGLWEQDDVRGSLPGLLRNTIGHWGNRLGRVSLLSPLGGVRTTTTVGISDFNGTIGPPPAAGGAPALDALPEHAATRNGMGVVTIGTEIAPADAGTRPTWSAGVQVALNRQDYTGQHPRPYPVVVLPDSLILREQFAVLSLWGERRWGLGRHAAIELGLRAGLHRAVPNAPALALEPKLAIRATPAGTRVTFTGALERSWQYSQALAPAGPSVGPDLYVTDVWFLAGDTIPAMRADIATVGVELWLGAGWTASANGFARRVTGVAVPEPSVGPLNSQRPIFVTATGDARGVELSARRLVGRWTASVAYSYGRSMLEDVSKLNGYAYRYPSAADRRHLLGVTAMLRLGAAWRAGAAFTAASGAPYSRFLLGVGACDTTVAHTCSVRDTAALMIEAPNGERTPAYQSLDLLLDWSREVKRVHLGAYVQLRNVLNRTNAVTYTGSITACSTPSPPTLVAVPSNPGVCDRFDKGVPILPLVGIRVSF